MIPIFSEKTMLFIMCGICFEHIAPGRCLPSYFSFQFTNILTDGLPWWSSDYDSMLPVQGTQIRTLVGKIPHAVKCGQKQTKKQKIN